eukprot:48265_1
MVPFARALLFLLFMCFVIKHSGYDGLFALPVVSLLWILFIMCMNMGGSRIKWSAREGKDKDCTVVNGYLVRNSMDDGYVGGKSFRRICGEREYHYHESWSDYFRPILQFFWPVVVKLLLLTIIFVSADHCTNCQSEYITSCGESTSPLKPADQYPYEYDVVISDNHEMNEEVHDSFNIHGTNNVVVSDNHDMKKK